MEQFECSIGTSHINKHESFICGTLTILRSRSAHEMSQISSLGGKFQTTKNNGFSSRQSGKRLKMKFKEDKQYKNAKKCDSTISFHVHFKKIIQSELLQQKYGTAELVKGIPLTI